MEQNARDEKIAENTKTMLVDKEDLEKLLQTAKEESAVSRADDDPFAWWKRDDPGPGNWELFDLEADRTETKNLASDRPDLVQSLAESLGSGPITGNQYREWSDRLRDVEDMIDDP